MGMQTQTAYTPKPTQLCALQATSRLLRKTKAIENTDPLSYLPLVALGTKYTLRTPRQTGGPGKVLSNSANVVFCTKPRRSGNPPISMTYATTQNYSTPNF